MTSIYNAALVDRKQDKRTIIHALPLLWLSLAFLVGIVLASAISAPWWLWLLWLVPAGVAATVAARLRTRLGWLPMFAPLAAGALFLGAARYQGAQPQFGPQDLATYNDSGQQVTVRGSLDRPPVKDGYVQLFVQAEEIVFPDGSTHNVRGLLLVTTSAGGAWNYGDRLQVLGELTTPPEFADFSYRDYLARQNVYSQMQFAEAERLGTSAGNPFWATLYAIRQRGEETLYLIYPAPEASLLSGILLGDESGIGEDLKTAYNDTGTRHIIAISGFNITVIIGLILPLFGRWVGRRRGIWIAGVFVTLYTLLVGADPPVVRAAIMGILALVALQTGRQYFALNSLAASAVLMTAINPSVLWDAGFQLTFAATLGILLYSQGLIKRTNSWIEARVPDWAQRFGKAASAYLLMTLAAQVTTLPLLLYYFHRMSIYSLLTNLLILPAQPALMTVCGLSLIFGMVVLPLGQVIGFFGWITAAYTNRIVEFFASLPFSTFSLDHFAGWMVAGYFAFLAIFSIPGFREWVKSAASAVAARISSWAARIIAPAEQRIHSIPPIPALGLIFLFTISVWVWNSELATPDGKLYLTLLAVDGEAFLIQTPEDRNVLIDTGSSSNALLSEVSQRLPMGQDIDWLIVAGRRSDQIGGIAESIQRLSPQTIGWAIDGTGEQLTILRNLVTSSGNQVNELESGDSLELGRGARLDVVRVGNRGAILLLAWDRFKALLPLGMDFDMMDELDSGAWLGPVDILLLGDSAYPPLNPSEWIHNLTPQVLWVAREAGPSVEKTGNDWDGIPLYSTDRNGWLQVTTDGQQLWMEIAHK